MWSSGQKARLLNGQPRKPVAVLVRSTTHCTCTWCPRKDHKTGLHRATACWDVEYCTVDVQDSQRCTGTYSTCFQYLRLECPVPWDSRGMKCDTTWQGRRRRSNSQNLPAYGYTHSLQRPGASTCTWFSTVCTASRWAPATGKLLAPRCPFIQRPGVTLSQTQWNRRIR